MNALTLLKQDHRRVRGLFRDFDSAGERAHREKERVARQVFEELAMHTAIEEEIFYPAVRDAGNSKGKGVVYEAIAEHDVVSNIIDELRALPIEDEQYDAKFIVLEENVKRHIEEEEGEMFPYAKRRLDETQLRDCGRQMADRKAALGAPSMIANSVEHAKKLVSEVMEAITPAAEKPRRRTRSDTRSHTRSKKAVAAATAHRSRKRGHTPDGRAHAQRAGEHRAV